MRILLTRPHAQAEPLARILRERGDEVRIEPMLTVVFLDGEAPDLDKVAALLFTSANGVLAFARRSSCRERAVFAVGDATAAEAREAGFTRVESAAGDVGSLAALVAERLDPADGVLLHVSGRTIAGDLAGDLEGRGFALRRAVLYRTEPAREFSPGLKKSLARGHLDVVLFFSPRTAATFVEGAVRAGLSRALGGLTALCLSEAVAGRLRGFGWRRVEVAERLDAGAMLDRLDRLRGGGSARKTEDDGIKDGRPEASGSEDSGPKDNGPEDSGPKDSGTEKGMTETTSEETGATPEPSDPNASAPEPSAANEEKAEEGEAGDAPQGSEEAPARPRRRGRIFLLLLLLLLIAGGGFVFGTKEGKDWFASTGLPMPQVDLSGLQSELARLQEDLFGTQPGLSGARSDLSLPQSSTPDSTASDSTSPDSTSPDSTSSDSAGAERPESTVQEVRPTLGAGLDAGGQAGEQLGERIDALAKRIDSLDGLLNELQFTLANLAAGTAGGGEAAAERVSAVDKRLERLPGIEKQLAGIEARMAAQKTAMDEAAPAPAGEVGVAAEAAAERLSELEKSIEQQLAGIEARMAAQKTAMDEAAPAGEVGVAAEAAAERLAELEKSIEQQLAGIEARMAAQKTAMDEAASAGTGEAAAEAAAGRLSELEKRLETLPGIEQQLAQIKAQLSAQKTATEKASQAGARVQSADSFLLAAARLRQVLESDGPFTDELAALRLVSGDSPAVRRLLAPLEAHAETGIADRRTLRRRFEVAAREAESAGVADESPVAEGQEAEGQEAAGQEAAGQEAEDAGMLSRALSNVSSFVSVRRIGEAATIPEESATAGHIGNARRSLAEDDLGAAVSALEQLPKERAEAFTSWISEARARLAAGRNGAALLSLATDRAAVTRNSPDTAPAPVDAP